MFLLALACTGDAGDNPAEPLGPASDDVWDDRYVPVYRLIFDGDDWASSMEALLPEDDCDPRPYVTASMEYENPKTGETERYDSVGVRYRGHSAIRDGQRWGFKVSVNEFDREADFHGLHNLNFLGTEGDFSLMRERLAQQVMRDAGIPAPRVGHVELEINGELQGVFPFAEEADDDPYLDHHFSSDDGGLYKIDGYCGGRADFQYKSDKVDRYEDKYEPKADTPVESIADDIIPLLECAKEKDEELMECLPEIIDLDEWLMEMAVDMALPDVDGLAGAGQNFMIYRDPAIDRLVVYPWDKDQAFSTDAAESLSIFDLHPEWASPPDLTVRMRELWKDSFCAAVLDVTDRSDVAALDAEITRIEALLAAPMARDPWFLDAGESWSGAVGVLRSDVADRHDDVVSEASTCSP